MGLGSDFVAEKWSQSSQIPSSLPLAHSHDSVFFLRILGNSRGYLPESGGGGDYLRISSGKVAHPNQQVFFWRGCALSPQGSLTGEEVARCAGEVAPHAFHVLAAQPQCLHQQSGRVAQVLQRHTRQLLPRQSLKI